VLAEILGYDERDIQRQRRVQSPENQSCERRLWSRNDPRDIGIFSGCEVAPRLSFRSVGAPRLFDR
jgi:hypothetical protein